VRSARWSPGASARNGQSRIGDGISTVRIGDKQMYVWRAVDAEGGVLEVLVQAGRDAWECQEFRVRGGMMGEKEIPDVPTQGTPHC
jgi:hypothetical protein